MRVIFYFELLEARLIDNNDNKERYGGQLMELKRSEEAKIYFLQ